MGAVVTYSNALANLFQCFSIRGSRPKARMGWTSADKTSSNLLLVLIFSSNYPIFHGIIFIFLQLWTIQNSGHTMLRCLCFMLACMKFSLPWGASGQVYMRVCKNRCMLDTNFSAWTKPWQIICVIFQSEAVLAQAPWPCYVRELLLSPATEAMWKQSDHEVEQIYCFSSLLPPQKISNFSPCHWIVLT